MSELRSLSRWIHFLRSEKVLWPLGFFIAIVGHVASHGIVELFAGHPPMYWWAWTGAFIGLTLFFYFLYRNPLVELVPGSNRWQVFVRESVPWLVASAAGVATFGVAVSIQSLGTTAPVDVLSAIGYLIVLFVVGRFLYLRRGEFLVVRTRELRQEDITEGTAEGHRRSHVVWLLSFVTKGLEPREGLPNCLPASVADGSRSVVDELATVLSTKEQWNWEMLLRALGPHTKSGERVVLTLVCSLESLPQAKWAAAILRRYREFAGLHVRVWAMAVEDPQGRFMIAGAAERDWSDKKKFRGVAFNRVDDLSLALTELLRHIRTIDQAKPEQITIDITGGQKPASLVAGAVTFRSESKAQYVETEGTKPVFEYDVVIDPEPRGA